MYGSLSSFVRILHEISALAPAVSDPPPCPPRCEQPRPAPWLEDRGIDFYASAWGPFPRSFSSARSGLRTFDLSTQTYQEWRGGDFRHHSSLGPAPVNPYKTRAPPFRTAGMFAGGGQGWGGTTALRISSQVPPCSVPLFL